MRKIFTPLFLLFYGLFYGQVTINVSTYGAVGDSATVNTDAIQRAIDSVTAKGGGTVLIDAGIYTTSTIILKSNVTLRITPDTKLKSIKDINSMPMIPYNTPGWTNVDYTQQSMIFAEDAVNIRITGGGTIDGFGGYDNITNILSVSNKNFRPFGLRLHEVSGLIIDSINLMEAPQWMAHLNGCSNVYINAVNVYNQGLGANDGIDIDACRTVLVENSNFDTNDDCIPVKTQANDSICRDVTIRNCTMASYERPVKVGNECFGPIVNVRFENITVKPSSFRLGIVPYNAIYIAVADGGSIDSVVINNVHVDTTYQSALFIRLCQRDFSYNSSMAHPPVKYVRNVWISNVNCMQSTNIPSSVTGMPGYDVQNINLKNIHVTVPGNGRVNNAPDSLDEHLTTRPEFNIWNDSLPAYGLFIWHANGVYLDSFCVDTIHYDPRPFYNTMDTVNIRNLNPCSYYDIEIPAAVRPVAADKEVRVYPNPAKDLLQIDNLPVQAEALALYTMTGERVAIIPTLGRGQATVNISKFPAGVYILTAFGYQYEVNRKVVITR